MMNNALDMSLDDLIKNSKQAGRGGGGRGRGRWRRGGGFGSFRTSGLLRVRGGPNRATARPSPFELAKAFSRASDGTWQRDLFGDSVGAPARSLGIETGTKLYISNLDFGVSNEDIKELFSEVGDLKRCSIHYDRSGRSKGTAEVVFSRRQDAVAGMNRYNTVQLDGKPMKIELIGTNLSSPFPRALNGSVTAAGRGRRTVVLTGARGRGFGLRGFRGRGRGRGRGRSRGRGRGRGRGWWGFGRERSPRTAEELDKELEKYHADAMQIS